MPNRPVRDKWDYPRKMERHFPIKPRQPIGIGLATFYHFRIFLIRAKNWFVKNGTANFYRNIPTEISGPPPEVIPNIPVGRNRNGPFHLNSDRNFRNLRHNGSTRCHRTKVLRPYRLLGRGRGQGGGGAAQCHFRFQVFLIPTEATLTSKLD